MKTLKLLLGVLFVSIAACSDGPTPPPPSTMTSVITSVTIAPTLTTLYPPQTQTQQHVCTVTGTGTFNRDVTWSSNAPNGLFT